MISQELQDGIRSIILSIKDLRNEIKNNNITIASQIAIYLQSNIFYGIINTTEIYPSLDEFGNFNLYLTGETLKLVESYKKPVLKIDRIELMEK